MIEITPLIPNRIVAEISRSWKGQEAPNEPILCQKFEQVIRHNAARGFELESWHMVCPSVLGSFHETIIAVFVQRP